MKNETIYTFILTDRVLDQMARGTIGRSLRACERDEMIKGIQIACNDMTYQVMEKIIENMEKLK